MFSLVTNLCSQRVSLLLRNGFKSAINIENLYPASNQNILEKPELKIEKKTTTDGKELFSGFIPIEQLQISHKTSRKPGGQNVNKTNSAVEIRFHVDTASWIPDWIREKLKEQQASKITKDGFFIITSEKTRKNMLNQADCLDRIRSCIREASKLPRGLSVQEKIKSEISKKIADGQRLNSKRRESELKSFRKGKLFDRFHDSFI